jgi:hypothetical protein
MQSGFGKTWAEDLGRPGLGTPAAIPPVHLRYAAVTARFGRLCFPGKS